MAATGAQIYEALLDAWLKQAQGGCVLSYSIAGKSVTFNSMDSIIRAVREAGRLAADEEVDVGAFLVQFAEVSG